MSEFLPQSVRDELAKAQKAERRRKSRLRLHADGSVYPVVRTWDTGFALDADEAPHLRGLVDLYDGARHLARCLVIASEDTEGERCYEYKRATAATDRPPLDFDRDDDAPVALLPR